MIRRAIYTPATPDDAAELAARMRPDDAREVLQASLLGPAAAVAASMAGSEVCYAGRCGGVLFGCVGATAENLSTGQGMIWMLGTTSIDERPLSFLRGCGDGLRLAMAGVPECRAFSNWVPVWNERTRMWLEWLGAYFGNETMTINGTVFRKFTIER